MRASCRTKSCPMGRTLTNLEEEEGEEEIDGSKTETDGEKVEKE